MAIERHSDLECLVAVVLRAKKSPEELLAALRTAKRFPLIGEALTGLPEPLGQEHLNVVTSRLRDTLRGSLPGDPAGVVAELGVDMEQACVLLGVLAGLSVPKAVDRSNRINGQTRDRSTGTRWMEQAAKQVAEWVAEQDETPPALPAYLRCHQSRCAFIDPRGVRRTARSEDLVLPLTEVYISVRLGPDNPAEVEADLELVTDLPAESLQYHLLDDLLAFDEPEPTQSEHFSRLLRDRRWLVVLGDPGAGKTTLLNWLALKNAQAMENGTDRVLVDGRRLGLPDEERVDLGPVRLPVLLRAADYADELVRCQATGKPLPDIYDFLGRHAVANEPLAGDAAENARLIRRYLAAGQALVLVDGLDEITDVSLRQVIAGKLDAFASEHVPDPAEPRAYLPLPDDRAAWWTIRPSTPPSAGGNQLVVTSRIAGYKEAGLKGAATTVKIQPLEEEAIRRFTADWCLAVERARARVVPVTEEEIESRAAEAARALAGGIFGEPRTRRLATNPLLLTVLALLQRERGRMPTRRVELYEEATRVLVERRHVPDMELEEVIDILGPFALWLQENSNTGYADEKTLRGRIREGLLRVVEEAREADVDNFVRSAREQTGLLAEVGVGRYGFLHATFREYLVAKEVTRSTAQFREIIQECLHSPRWVEVLLLGAAVIAKDRPEDADGVLELILERSSPLEEMLHRDLVFAASCLNEMVRVSPSLAANIISRLFDVAAWSERNRFQDLQARVTDVLSQLSESRPRAIAPRLLESLRADHGTRAAAEIARRQPHPSLELLDALEVACASALYGASALGARADVATALHRAGELADAGYEPVRTLLDSYEGALAELDRIAPDVSSVMRERADLVCPPLRDAFQRLFEAVPAPDRDGASLREEFVIDLLGRAGGTHGVDFMLMFTAAAELSRVEAAGWLRNAYMSGAVDLASAARCVAHNPWIVESAGEQIEEWFAALPDASQQTLLEYQSFADETSPLVSIAWKHVAEHGMLGDATRVFISQQAVAPAGLPASREAFAALRRMLADENSETQSLAMALLPRLRASSATALADLLEIATEDPADPCCQQAAILAASMDWQIRPAQYDTLAAAITDLDGPLRADAISVLGSPRRLARGDMYTTLRRSATHQRSRKAAGDGGGAYAHGSFQISVLHDDSEQFLKLLRERPPGSGQLVGGAVHEVLREVTRLPPPAANLAIHACRRNTLARHSSGADLAEMTRLCQDLAGGPRMQAARLLGEEAVLAGSWEPAAETIGHLIEIGDTLAAAEVVRAATWQIRLPTRQGDPVMSGLLASRQVLREHLTDRDFAGVLLLTECAITTEAEPGAQPSLHGPSDAAAAVIDALTTDANWTYPPVPDSLQSRLSNFMARLAEHPRGMRAVIDSVVATLVNDRDDWRRRRAALLAADTAATASPALFLRSASDSRLRELAVATANDPESYSTRMLSINVLSHFRRLDQETIRLIARACQDAAHVAYPVLRRCQSISADADPDLAEIEALLGSPQPRTVAAAGAMLAALASAPTASASQRRVAEEALASAIVSTSPTADVLGGRDRRSLRSLLHDMLTGLAWHAQVTDTAQLLGSTVMVVIKGPAPKSALPKIPGLTPDIPIAQAVRAATRASGTMTPDAPPFKVRNIRIPSWTEIGLGDVPGPRLAHLARVLYVILEIRVGTVLASQMSNDQLDEFEAINAADTTANGIGLGWLTANFPRHPEIVREQCEKLFPELGDSLSAVRAALDERFRDENE